MKPILATEIRPILAKRITLAISCRLEATASWMIKARPFVAATTAGLGQNAWSDPTLATTIISVELSRNAVLLGEILTIFTANVRVTGSGRLAINPTLNAGPATATTAESVPNTTTSPPANAQTPPPTANSASTKSRTNRSKNQSLKATNTATCLSTAIY